MRGVVWDGERLVVTDALEVRAPGPGEVLVRVLASGVCHSDINMIDSGLVATPVVLGHEAAGRIEALGPGVSRFQVGAPVMVSTQAPCGHCRECDRGAFANCGETWGLAPHQPFLWRGQPTYSFANCSSFAELIVVRASQLFEIGELRPEQAALLGCAVSTGHGAVRRLGEAAHGDTVVVFGVGGIGVNAIQAARLNGAAHVLAVDINPGKEEAARQFGADLFVAAQRSDSSVQLAERVRVAAAGPIDVAVECSGAVGAIEAAIAAVKLGGVCVLVGMAKPGSTASFDIGQVTFGRKIVASMNGGTRPDEDFPTLIAQARSEAIDLKSQVTQVWPLAEIEDAIAALRAGRVTRAVVDHRR